MNANIRGARVDSMIYFTREQAFAARINQTFGG